MLASIVKVIEPTNQGSKSFSQMDFGRPKTPNFEPVPTEDEMFITSEIYRSRLKRRSELIEEIRCAYLRDVVLLKHFLEQHLLHDERAILMDQWKKAVPSLDLRQQLMLYSPPECSLNVLPCEVCGGQVEIVHHDSSEIEKLSKALDHLDKNEEELRLMIGTQAAKIELYENRIANADRIHNDEKRVLYNEMRQLKQSIEEVQKDNERYMKLNSQLRHENGDFKLAAMEQARTQASLDAAKSEVARLRSELRVAEESTAHMKESTAFMKHSLSKAEKSIADLTEKLNAEANDKESMKDDLALTKTNLDNALKRNAKLQSLLANARKEVADLESLKSSMAMDIENLQHQSATEIEGMEKMIDTMREEMSTTEGVLREVRAECTKLKNEKEQAVIETKSISDELHIVRAELTHEIEDLKARLEEIRNAHASDDASLEAAKKQVRKMSKDKNTRKTGTPMGGRRQGTLVFGTSREGTPDEAPPEPEPEKTVDPDKPPKSTRHASTKSRRQSKHGEGIASKSPKHREHVEAPSHSAEELHNDEIVVAATVAIESSELDQPAALPAPVAKEEGEEILFYNNEEPITVAAVETPPSSAQGRPATADKPKSSKSGPQVDYQAQLKAVKSSRASSKDGKTSKPQSSSSTTAEIELEENAEPLEEAAKDVERKQSSVSQKSPKLSLLASLSDESADENAIIADNMSPGAEHTNESVKKPQEPSRRSSKSNPPSAKSSPAKTSSAATERRHSVKSRPPTSSKSPKSSRPVSPTSSLAEESEEESEEEIVLSEANVAAHSPKKPPPAPNTTVKAVPKAIVRDDSASVGDSSFIHSPSVDSIDDDDLFQEEVTDEVARSWGEFNKEIKTLMLENMTLKESTRATEVIAPITIQYSSAIVKSVMNLWQVLALSQQNTNFLCRMKNLTESLQSCVSPEATSDDLNWALEEVERCLTAEVEENYTHWYSDYDVDEELMDYLVRKEEDPETGLLLPVRSFEYFGHNTADLNDRIDIVQRSISGIKAYNRDITERVCQLLKGILADWGQSKITGLSGGPVTGGGTGDLEETIFELQNEISLLKHNRQEAEKTRDKLQSELELSKAHVEELLPLVSRVKELTDRTHFLSNALRESNDALHDLEAKHKASSELAERLGGELTVMTDKYTTAQGIVDRNQSVVDGLLSDLAAERRNVFALSNDLSNMRETERKRLEDLNTVHVQTEPLVEEMGTQTDFLCPPLSLRHHVTEQYNNTKRVYFPIVTPASAPSSDYLPPSSANSKTRMSSMRHTIQDSYLLEQMDRAGLGSADSLRFTTPGSSYKDRSRPGSRQGKPSLEIGIPSVFAEAPGTPNALSSPMSYKKNEPIWASSVPRPNSRHDKLVASKSMGKLKQERSDVL